MKKQFIATLAFSLLAIGCTGGGSSGSAPVSGVINENPNGNGIVNCDVINGATLLSRWQHNGNPAVYFDFTQAAVEQVVNDVEYSESAAAYHRGTVEITGCDEDSGEIFITNNRFELKAAMGSEVSDPDYHATFSVNGNQLTLCWDHAAPACETATHIF